METLARKFDQPVDSAEHRDLAENGWIAGSYIMVRYWLGRLLQRNFFRESDDSVKAALRQYFHDRGLVCGAAVASDLQAWSPMAILLKHHVEVASGCAPTANPRLVAALEAVMADPALTDAQLAAQAKTTEKQVARMSDVFLIRKLWNLRRARPV